jgi:hypothetical protein
MPDETLAGTGVVGAGVEPGVGFCVAVIEAPPWCGVTGAVTRRSAGRAVHARRAGATLSQHDRLLFPTIGP